MWSDLDGMKSDILEAVCYRMCLPALVDNRDTEASGNELLRARNLKKSRFGGGGGGDGAWPGEGRS